MKKSPSLPSVDSFTDPQKSAAGCWLCALVGLLGLAAILIKLISA